MKRMFSVIALALSGVLAWSCESGPSQAEKNYQEMTTQMDSIKSLNDKLMAEHNEVMQNHDRMMQQIQAQPEPDSSMMETLAKHQVMYEGQKASFDKISSVMNAHEEFKTKHAAGNMTDAEIEGQVEQMKKDQEMILDEQDRIKEEIEMMRRDHEQVVNRMNDADNSANSEGMDQTQTGNMTSTK